MAIVTDTNRSVEQITLTFPTMGKLVFHAERVSDALRTYAMMDRFEAKIVDCMALERKKFPNSIVPEAVKFERASAMIAHLESGTTEWNPGRAANGSSDRALLGRALAEIGRTFKPEWLKDLSTKQVDALLADARIKPTADKLRADTVADVDVDALFDGMDSIPEA